MLKLELEKARKEKELEDLKSHRASDNSYKSSEKYHSKRIKVQLLKNIINTLFCFSWITFVYFIFLFIMDILILCDVFYEYEYVEIGEYIYEYTYVKDSYVVLSILCDLLGWVSVIGSFVCSIILLGRLKDFENVSSSAKSSSILAFVIFGLLILNTILSYFVDFYAFYSYQWILWACIIAFFVNTIKTRNLFNNYYGKRWKNVINSTQNNDDIDENYIIEED